MKMKRYSPLVMLFHIAKLLKNAIFFAFFLYVVKAGSESLFIKYGRIVFLIVVGWSLLSIIYEWFTHKYKLDEKSFHLYKGLFNKSEQTIPFSKIQNINRHTSFFHKIFHMTSIYFETGMKGENATVKFEVISPMEADQMEARVQNTEQREATDRIPESAHSEVQMEQQNPSHFDNGMDGENTTVKFEVASPTMEADQMEARILNTEQREATDQIPESDDAKVEIKQQNPSRTIHFQPTKEDILKASFTSLSFLVLFSLIGSLYFKVNDVFHLEDITGELMKKITSTWWVVTLIVIVLVITSIAFGIVRTYVKYGNYEISSDANHIYIRKGVIDEAVLSISKEKVQAIEVEQSMLKRLLGLAEVKLTSAGGFSSGDESLEINTLYPFLPVKKAYAMISDILPSYTITEDMTRLPKKSFWVRILWPSWFWFIATGALFYFKPAILGLEQAWIIVSAALLLCILIARSLDFFHTRYVINGQFIQFQKGALTTSLFISKREKVIEVKATRNFIQKMLGLASIETINRGKPVHHSGLDDVPVELANSFFQWYVDRKKEIRVE